MSKRLQVIVDDEEYAEIQRFARRQRTTVSEWVRRALRQSRRAEPRYETETKLSVIREAAAHEYPTADIGRMLEEIETGYTAAAE